MTDFEQWEKEVFLTQCVNFMNTWHEENPGRIRGIDKGKVMVEADNGAVVPWHDYIYATGVIRLKDGTAMVWRES